MSTYTKAQEMWAQATASMMDNRLETAILMMTKPCPDCGTRLLIGETSDHTDGPCEAIQRHHAAVNRGLLVVWCHIALYTRAGVLETLDTNPWPRECGVLVTWAPDWAIEIAERKKVSYGTRLRVMSYFAKNTVALQLLKNRPEFIDVFLKNGVPKTQGKRDARADSSPAKSAATDSRRR